MNKQLLLATVEALRASATAAPKYPDLGFNMCEVWSTGRPDLSGHNCGTTACIAGWINTVAGLEDKGSSFAAQAVADLSRDEADKLFFSDHDADVEFGGIKPLYAAAVLENFVMTSEVRWDLFDNNGRRK